MRAVVPQVNQSEVLEHSQHLLNLMAHEVSLSPACSLAVFRWLFVFVHLSLVDASSHSHYHASLSIPTQLCHAQSDAGEVGTGVDKMEFRIFCLRRDAQSALDDAEVVKQESLLSKAQLLEAKDHMLQAELFQRTSMQVDVDMLSARRFCSVLCCAVLCCAVLYPQLGDIVAGVVGAAAADSRAQ